MILSTPTDKMAKKDKLTISNLRVSLEDKEIIKGVNLTIYPGQIHAIMGPNGSGKSTLAQTLMGNPNYRITNHESRIMINKKNLINLKPNERARIGLFLAFQNPVAVPGVSVGSFLKTAYQEMKGNGKKKDGKSRKAKHNPALSVYDFNQKLVDWAEFLGMPKSFLGRSLNDDFSGGEKKKTEMLQALSLSPKFAVFDEIDTGLDIDALKSVAKGILKLKKQQTGILLITHYLRILQHIKPDFVHILKQGRIVKSGDYKLAQKLEKEGYAGFSR